MRILARVLICIALACPALAQKDQPGQPSQDEMMKAYQAAATPGPQHAMLAKSAGSWTCTVKSWMDPAGEPMVSEGTEEAEMIYGGRYLQSHFKGSMMGQPFEGMGLMGYDNVKKKYVGTWLDTMSTGIMPYEGDYDPQKKEIVCHGEFADAGTGQMQTCRLVSRFVNDNQHVFEMWGPDPSGKDVKWMEITYNRAR